MSAKLNLERVLQSSGCAAPMCVADAIEELIDARMRELFSGQEMFTLTGDESVPESLSDSLREIREDLAKLDDAGAKP